MMPDRRTDSGEEPAIREGSGTLPIALMLVVAAAIVSYIPAFQAGFVHDDADLIIGNKLVNVKAFDEGETGLAEIFTTGLFRGATGATSYYRPLMILLFRIEARLFDLDPFWYHLINVVLHTAAGIVLLLILCRLGIAPSAAAFGVCLFVVHPANTESVAWISAGANSMTLLLMGLAILSLLHYAGKGGRGLRDWRLWLAAAFWLAALLSKETAVILPLVALLVCTAGRRFGRLRVVVPFLAALALYLLLRIIALSGDVPDELFSGRGSVWERALTFCAVIPGYLSLLVWPVDLNIARPLTLSSSLFDPAAAGGAIVLAGALALIVWSWRKGYGAVLLGASLFLFSFLAVSNLVPIPYSFTEMDFPFFERYLYLPSAGLAVIAAALVHLLLKPRFMRRRIPALLLAVLAVAPLALLGSRTYQRCKDWKDDETLFKSALSLYPSSPSLNLNFGVAQQRQGRFREAIAAFHKTISLDPEMWMARFNEAVSLFEIGREKSSRLSKGGRPLPFSRIEEIDQAEQVLLELLEDQPFNEMLLFEMGRMLEERGQLMGALHLYAAACCLAEEGALCWKSLDRVAEKLKYWIEEQFLAREDLDTVMSLTKSMLDLIPNLAWAYEVRGLIQLGRGERKAAVESFLLAVRMAPDSVAAGQSLAEIFREEGDEANALAMDLYVRRALERVDLEGAMDR